MRIRFITSPDIAPHLYVPRYLLRNPNKPLFGMKNRRKGFVGILHSIVINASKLALLGLMKFFGSFVHWTWLFHLADDPHKGSSYFSIRNCSGMEYALCMLNLNVFDNFMAVFL